MPRLLQTKPLIDYSVVPSHIVAALLICRQDWCLGYGQICVSPSHRVWLETFSSLHHLHQAPLELPGSSCSRWMPRWHPSSGWGSSALSRIETWMTPCSSTTRWWSGRIRGMRRRTSPTSTATRRWSLQYYCMYTGIIYTSIDQLISSLNKIPRLYLALSLIVSFRCRYI